MALNLSLSATINTARTEITLTDTTNNWGVDGEINFNAVMYAELYVGIRGAMYGPVIITGMFNGATSVAELVYTLTPSILGLDTDTFDDAIHEYHYGVSSEANPTVVSTNIWVEESTYSFPLGDTANKIPFTYLGDNARSYILQATFNLAVADPGVNPRITLIVNYQDNTSDTTETAIPKTGIDTVVSATVNIDRSKEIKNVTGLLFNEDRSPRPDRQAEISVITLNKTDLELESNIIRALVSEKTKVRINREAIRFGKSFLCGRVQFDEHEKFIVEVTAFDSVTVGANRGLVDDAEEIIDFLNDDTTC